MPRRSWRGMARPLSARASTARRWGCGVPPCRANRWRSRTHRVRWVDGAIEAGDLIGAPGDYAREPWFSGGALRFVAVHAGGIAAVFDRTRAHLIETDRADDLFQTARLAELFELADGAAGVVRCTAQCWFSESDATRLPRIAAARLAVATAGARAIAVAQEAVGLPGMFQAHPLATAMTDLAVYLRQPPPDAQRLRVGRAAAAGALTPIL